MALPSGLFVNRTHTKGTGTMHRRITAIILAMLFFVPALQAAAGYTLLRAPEPDDPMQASIFQLENGLTVYITEYRQEPRFHAEIAVRAGSKHDPPEATGLAHYLEHLLFKGSARMGTVDYDAERDLLEYIANLYELHFHETDPAKRRALYAQINAASAEAARYAVPNEMDRLYSAMGGTALNAHTWVEETVYKVSLPGNRLRHWAAIESERFAQPVFRLFQTELETVYEEMNRALDNKHRIISQAVAERLFKTHPYGQQPTLGLPEHLKNPSLRHIAAFYETYYVPNNMAICLSGDIDTQEAIAVIDEYFSRWQPRELPEPKTWDEPPLAGREYVERSYEGEEFAMLAFRTVPNGHPDAEALQVLDMVLDNATAGLINLNLNQRQRVRAAGSHPAQYNDHGAQYLWGIPKEGQSLEEVESLLLEQIGLLRAGDFEDWILEAILLDFRKNQAAMLEDNASRVAAMRNAFLTFEDWERALARLDRIAAVTKDDVVRVANAYFSRGYVAGYRVDAPHEVRQVEKPELAVIEIDPDRSSAFAAEIAALDAPEIEPAFVDPATDFAKVEDPAGRTLYHAPNPVNDLFSLTITVDFGDHQDRMIGMAALLLDKAGTENLAPDELKKAWYRIGTNFGISVGDNETNITLSGLDDRFAESLGLLAQILGQPAADPETLEELKRIVIKQRADAKKDPESIARALTLFHRYGGESPFLRRLSTDELAALTVEELLGAVKSLLGYRHSVSYTGSLPLEQVRAALGEHLPAAGTLADPPPYKFLTAHAPEQSQVYFVARDTATATVRIEFGDVVFDEALTPAAQLFNEYFAGGMAGLVFQELREARALAYSAGARYFQGDRAGAENLMVAAIQTQADKTPDAAAAFIELLDRMPLSEERFAMAKQSVVSLYRTARIGFRDLLGTVRAWEKQGLEPDPRAARYPIILESSLDTVARFQAERVRDRAKLISIVGNRENVDMDALAAIAPVTEIQVDDIYRD